MRRYVSAAVSPPSAYASSASRGVQGVPVGVGVDGDAGQAGVAAGADDPDGDLAAVGDEYLAHLATPPGEVTLTGSLAAESAGEPNGSLSVGCRTVDVALVKLAYYACAVSTTRMMILGLVRWMQPVHGYDVRRELLSWSADKWANVQPGSIYHALRKLTEEGLLEAVATEQVGARPARTTYVTPRATTSSRTLLRRLLVGVPRAARPVPGRRSRSCRRCRAAEAVGALRNRARLLRAGSTRCVPRCESGLDAQTQAGARGLDVRALAGARRGGDRAGASGSPTGSRPGVSYLPC